MLYYGVNPVFWGQNVEKSLFRKVAFYWLLNGSTVRLTRSSSKKEPLPYAGAWFGGDSSMGS